VSTGACCCVDVDEPYAVLQQGVIAAKGPEECGECGAAIEPGEDHEFFQGTMPGERTPQIYTHRTCMFCLAVRRDFFSCGWFFGSMREDFYSCNGWDYAGEWPDESWVAVEEQGKEDAARAEKEAAGGP